MKVKAFKKVRQWGVSVIAMIIGSILILTMLMFFSVSTKRTIENFIHSNMDEMNEAAIVSLNRSMNNFMDLLEKQAEVFGIKENLTDDEIIKILQEFSTKEKFKNTAIVTYEGDVYSSFRGKVKAGKEDNLPNLYKPETIISQPRTFHDGTLVIDISTPVIFNGTEEGKLVVSLGSDDLASMFNDNILQGDAALNLITQDGLVITRISKRQSILKPKDNLFELYNNQKLELVKGSVEDLSESLKSGKDIWIKYKYNNSMICASFIPFGRNNWSMAIAATDSTVSLQSGIIERDGVILTLGVMAVMIIVSIIVIIQRIKEQQRMDALKNTYSIAIRKSNDLFYEADIDNDKFTDYSEKADTKFWKETPKKYSLALERMADMCVPEFRDQFLAAFLPQNIRIKMEQGISSINFEYKITLEEDSERWLSATFVPVDDGTGSIKLICMENDITEHKMKQEMLQESATLDGLTGLYNKVITKNYIDCFFDNEGKEGKHALVLIDIDYFKQVNDNLGHAKGDEVLVELGTILKKTFRKSDIIGRIGGDEFIVLLKDYGLDQLIISKMELISEQFNKEYKNEKESGTSFGVSVSIGIAIYSKDGRRFDELYRNADIALYNSKNSGKNKYTFYTI